jgi:hypothetical protein
VYLRKLGDGYLPALATTDVGAPAAATAAAGLPARTEERPWS